jgi:hypothetical protein
MAAAGGGGMLVRWRRPECWLWRMDVVEDRADRKLLESGCICRLLESWLLSC